MAQQEILDHHDIVLRPDPARTVIRPFSPEYPPRFAKDRAPRAEQIADRVLALDEAQLAAALSHVTQALDERHRDVDRMLLRRFDDMCKLDGKHQPSDDQKRLIGAYFSEEYSFEAAALFNPSVVVSRDQAGVADGSVRFTMSLRGIGEGHVSSVTFRRGTWTPGGGIEVDPPSPSAVPPIIEGPSGDDGTTVKLQCGGSREISETVLFPVLPSQRQGIEDLRLVRFIDDDGAIIYYGTYTAFSGASARPELLSGIDFKSFEMRPLTGDAADAKGMALFPRRIDGRYAMLGRQDSESIWLHVSGDLYHWEGGQTIVSPRYPWEFVQVGNCGSPIEIDEGWLVLTHGVSTVRTYCMGACLLDKKDPSKLLARTREPILEPSAKERDGYVPNVVYSCGSLVHDRTLLLPYGVADNFATFATTPIDRLLAVME